jgi:ATP-binding cassette subfamily B multidrug efflux pump
VSTPQRPPPPGAPPRTPPPLFGNRPIGGLGVPTQKAKDFKGTVGRLAGYLRPHRNALVVVVIAGALGTIFSVLGPKILGLVTTKIFE